jgi:hypothetical protein
MRVSNQPFSLLPVLLWINTIRAYPDGHLTRRAADCSNDNCARAVTGTRHGLDFQSSARADCSNFMHAIQTVPAAYVLLRMISDLWQRLTKTRNITVTTSAAFFPNSSITSIDATGAIPTYASACSESSDYASACSCWGITRATITSATGVGSLSASLVMFS